MRDVVIDTSLLCEIAYKEARDLGKLLGVDNKFIDEVGRKSCEILEKYSEIDPRDIVRAIYHILLKKNSQLTMRRRTILSNPSLSWLELVPIVYKYI